MFIEESDAETRINSNKNLRNSLALSPAINQPTAEPKRRDCPEFLREIMGTDAHFEGVRNATKPFGFDKMRAFHAIHGRTEYGLDVEGLKEKIEINLSGIRDVAMGRLMSSLGLLTDKKIEKEDAKGIASVASSMAKVVDMTLPKDVAIDNSKVQVIMYAPNLKQETDFEAIDVTPEKVERES